MNIRRIRRLCSTLALEMPAARRMGATLSFLGIAALVLKTIGPAPAQATPIALGPPPGGPDLPRIAYAAADFPGARVKRHGYVKPDADLGLIAEYDREFRVLSVKVGGERLLALEDDVGLARNADDAAGVIDFFALAVGLGSSEMRNEFARGFGVEPSAVKVGSPVKAGAGDDSFALRIAIRTRAGEVDVILSIVRVGPLDSFIYLAGAPKVRLGAADTKRLARLAVRHMRQGLAPVSTSLPLVSGIPQDGQIPHRCSGHMVERAERPRLLGAHAGRERRRSAHEHIASHYRGLSDGRSDADRGRRLVVREPRRLRVPVATLHEPGHGLRRHPGCDVAVVHGRLCRHTLEASHRRHGGQCLGRVIGGLCAHGSRHIGDVRRLLSCPVAHRAPSGDEKDGRCGRCERLTPGWLALPGVG